jgi:peptide/nickel transport system permease protein
MKHFLIQRLVLALPTLIGITILTFVGLRVVIPGNVVDIVLAQAEGNDEELEEQLREDLGLNGSLPSQYLRWVGRVLQGDFGESLHTGRPIGPDIARRAAVSFELGAWGLFSAIIVSVPLGVWAAARQDKWPDYGLRSFAILVDAMPGFWIAVLIITFGSIWFNWAPPIDFKQLTDDPIAHLKIMLLPAVIIGITPSGGLLRLVRTQMLEVLRQDYIRTAYAKGLPERVVFYRHALRNSMLPVVTVIGLSLPGVVAGTVIFEQIFVIPGMGRYLVEAVNQRDYPIIQAVNLLFALLLVAAVIIVDLTYSLLDPRVRAN